MSSKWLRTVALGACELVVILLFSNFGFEILIFRLPTGGGFCYLLLLRFDIIFGYLISRLISFGVQVTASFLSLLTWQVIK